MPIMTDSRSAGRCNYLYNLYNKSIYVINIIIYLEIENLVNERFFFFNLLSVR